MNTPDLSAHPVTVIIGTLGSLISVAAVVWGGLTYIRKRWIAPFVHVFNSFMSAVALMPEIRNQLFSDGKLTLRETVDKIHHRCGLLEAREKAMLNEHDNAIFSADEMGRTVWVNRTYCRMFEMSEDEALGYGWKNKIIQNEREAYTKEWHSAVADNREFSATMTCYVEGRWQRFNVRAYPVGDQPNSVLRGYNGFIEPVEESD